jgi:hypothetical protein
MAGYSFSIEKEYPATLVNVKNFAIPIYRVMCSE